MYVLDYKIEEEKGSNRDFAIPQIIQWESVTLLDLEIGTV